MLAASVPVHAPVPGSGIPTNRSSATKSPLPAFSCSFCPPFSPFSRQKRKNLPITGLSAPHSSTRLAKRYINGTGTIFPITATIYACRSGRLTPGSWEYGIAPRSSISGTIETKNTNKYFFNINTPFIFYLLFFFCR